MPPAPKRSIAATEPPKPGSPKRRKNPKESSTTNTLQIPFGKSTAPAKFVDLAQSKLFGQNINGQSLLLFHFVNIVAAKLFDQVQVHSHITQLMYAE